jgi:hypothetical protein
MDWKMEQNLAEKGDTSDLVRDGVLLEENPQGMNLGELMRIAMAEFRTEKKTVDESVIEVEWPDLKPRLREAAEARHRSGGASEVSQSASELVSERPAHEPTKIIVLLSASAQATLAAVHPWLARLRRRWQPA